MSKRQINARISDHTRTQIDALCATMGETQTGVIAIAIDRMAREEGMNTYTTQDQQYIIDHLGAENWQQVMDEFGRLTYAGTLLALNEMFPQEDNKELAKKIKDQFR